MYAPVLRPPASVSSPETAYPLKPRLPHARAVREEGSEYQAPGRYTQYEAEGSEQRALGSISVAADAWWAAALTVPIPDATVAFFHIERHGRLPAGYRGGERAVDLALPIDEVQALLALLIGVVTQARRDGVLPASAP